jgi:thioredoxin-like negative regulator of GroEL
MGLKLLKFSAKWCKPCQRLSGQLAKIDFKKYDVDVVEVNIETDSAKTIEYKIKSIPTLILEKDGAEISRKTGEAHSSEVETWLTENRG